MSKYESLADAEADGFSVAITKTASLNPAEQFKAELQRYTSGTFHSDGSPMQASRPVRYFGLGGTEEEALRRALGQASWHADHLERIGVGQL